MSLVVGALLLLVALYALDASDKSFGGSSFASHHAAVYAQAPSAWRKAEAYRSLAAAVPGAAVEPFPHLVAACRVVADRRAVRGGDSRNDFFLHSLLIRHNLGCVLFGSRVNLIKLTDVSTHCLIPLSFNLRFLLFNL